jgi:hypothetical protein
MGYHIVRDSEDHMEVLSDKEYQQRQSGKGCLTVLVLAVIIGSLFYYQGDKKPDKTKTEVVSEKSQSVETKTEQPVKSQVVIEEENPTTDDYSEVKIEINEEKKVEKNEDEKVEEDVSSGKEEKSININDLVKIYQNKQDQ